MAIKTIPLSRLEMDLETTLTDCANSGETMVVELPDQRRLAISPLDSDEQDDHLIDDLIQNNEKFRALIEKSNATPLKPFVPRESVDD